MSKTLSVFFMLSWWFYIPVVMFGQFMHGDYEYTLKEMWNLYWEDVVERWWE